MLIEDGGKCRTQGELIAGSRTSSHQLNGYDLSLPANPPPAPLGSSCKGHLIYEATYCTQRATPTPVFWTCDVSHVCVCLSVSDMHLMCVHVP